MSTESENERELLEVEADDLWDRWFEMAEPSAPRPFDRPDDGLRTAPHGDPLREVA